MALAEAPVPRMHLTKRLISLRRAQPAPPLHTRGVLPAERRETAWVLVAGGQQGRCRGVGWGRWDGLIGYGIPTAGRLCAAPISGMGQPGQVLLECWGLLGICWEHSWWKKKIVSRASCGGECLPGARNRTGGTTSTLRAAHSPPIEVAYPRTEPTKIGSRVAPFWADVSDTPRGYPSNYMLYSG